MQKFGLATWLLCCIYGTRIEHGIPVTICVSVFSVDMNCANSVVGLEKASFTMKMSVDDLLFLNNRHLSNRCEYSLRATSSDFRPY